MGKLCHISNPWKIYFLGNANSRLLSNPETIQPKPWIAEASIFKVFAIYSLYLRRFADVIRAIGSTGDESGGSDF
jgi:hypothetical protein